MIKRDRIDSVFSELVRERANWSCENCGRYFSEGNRYGIHCSHLAGRRRSSLRHHPLGAVAHCRGCHQKLGEDPIGFCEWIKNHFSEDDYQRFLERKNRIVKLTKRDKDELYQWLKDQLKIMKGLRAKGHTGYLQFNAWPGYPG